MTSPVTGTGPPADLASSRPVESSAPAATGTHSSEEHPAAMVEVSPEGHRRAEVRASEPHLHALSEAAARAEAEEAVVSEGVHPHGNEGVALTRPEQEEVERLQRRDAEVRTHEAAHMAAGGGLTGGVAYSFKTGPDGKRYATGGEVSIRMGKGRTPEETIRRAQTIRAAALAPAEPSGHDRAVAASASRMESQARQELARQRELEAAGATGKAPEHSMAAGA